MTPTTTSQDQQTESQVSAALKAGGEDAAMARLAAIGAPKPSLRGRGRPAGGHGFGFAVFCGDEGYLPDSSSGPFRSLKAAASFAAGEAASCLDGGEDFHKTGDALRDGRVAVFDGDGRRVARWTVEPLLEPWGGSDAHLPACDGFCQPYGDAMTCNGSRTDG